MCIAILIMLQIIMLGLITQRPRLLSLLLFEISDLKN